MWETEDDVDVADATIYARPGFSNNQLAIMEQKKADERMLKLRHIEMMCIRSTPRFMLHQAFCLTLMEQNKANERMMELADDQKISDDLNIVDRASQINGMFFVVVVFSSSRPDFGYGISNCSVDRGCQIKGNSHVKDNKIDLFVQKYVQFSILEDESIDKGFSKFNTIITSLKALDDSFSSKNYVRKFLRDLHPKWRAKVTAIEQAKDLPSLSLDEFIRNLKVYEMIMEKDSELIGGKQEKMKSLTLMGKKESSDDETSTSGSEDEEYVMAFGGGVFVGGEFSVEGGVRRCLEGMDDDDDEVSIVEGVLMGAFGGFGELSLLERGGVVISSSLVKLKKMKWCKNNEEDKASYRKVWWMRLSIGTGSAAFVEKCLHHAYLHHHRLDERMSHDERKMRKKYTDNLV
ncbi:hypothetical protein Tco_0389551 [Tanacetum coccineum]